MFALPAHRGRSGAASSSDGQPTPEVPAVPAEEVRERAVRKLAVDASGRQLQPGWRVLPIGGRWWREQNEPAQPMIGLKGQANLEDFMAFLTEPYAGQAIKEMS